MTVDTNKVEGEPASVSVGYPVTVGWTHAAIAVNSSLRLSAQVNLKMHIEMHGPLLIDFRHHAFSWSTPLEIFPVDAVHTGLETELTSADDPPYFELPGHDLDGLLWEMGINSFGGAAAYWLPPGERYRLTRWPNLTQHRHTMHQMQMMAVLGNTFVSVSELAALTGAEESEAQRLINALSLMRILTRTSAAPAAEVATAAAVATQTAATTRLSLFARLRKRLGR
jgi:hypothetical protein